MWRDAESHRPNYEDITMAATWLSPSSDSGHSRLRWMLRVMFVLLLAYFIVDRAFPGAMDLYRSPQRQVINARSGPPTGSGVQLRGIPRVTVDGDRIMLRGGINPSQSFDISQSSIEAHLLTHGLGREYFPALIEPEFISSDEAEEAMVDDERVIIVNINGDVRIYPVDQLRYHELVNDVVGGRPIFVAFCVLADLGGVYDRTIGDHTFTFAVSGYTYAQMNVWQGASAFVLWDRDTESLWWPPVGKAVTGPMHEAPLSVTDTSLWTQATWAEAHRAHPDARVLKAGQSFEPPTSWPVYRIPDDVKAELVGAEPDVPVTVSRWGKNAGL